MQYSTENTIIGAEQAPVNSTFCMSSILMLLVEFIEKNMYVVLISSIISSIPLIILIISTPSFDTVEYQIGRYIILVLQIAMTLILLGIAIYKGIFTNYGTFFVVLLPFPILNIVLLIFTFTSPPIHAINVCLYSIMLVSQVISLVCATMCQVIN